MESRNENSTLWRAIVGIVMISAGCACFILSCVATMVLCRD